MARILSRTCLIVGCGAALAASAAAQRPPAPGTYRLQHQTADKRWDGHTLAHSEHRGALTLTLGSGQATLALEDHWSYNSSSDHGVSGGPIRRLFREIDYRYRWAGRVKRSGATVVLSLKVGSARCAAFGRWRRTKPRRFPCEERPPLALTCALRDDAVYPPAPEGAENPAVVAKGEQARTLPTLRCSSAKPLPSLLAHAAVGGAIPFARGAPLQLFAERDSDEKPRVALRRR